ncbi:MAG TPA: peptidyl-tRNA hydrolase Pth2 [Candidatus Thermoplasmatota archaeon]|nr:peptidyl-tRNA hydrolase Pth2 [Candidatus Thermoplasmatota archaeon]
MAEMKMVIVARKDIKLSAGKLAAQVAHAAVSCAMKARRYQAERFDEWYEQGQKKVVVKGPDLASLFALKDLAERAGLTTALITDAGHTELPPNTTTCLGIGPAEEREVDKITSHLPLY